MHYLLIPLYGFADRAWGGGLAKFDKPDDGIKLAFVAAVLAAIASYLIGGAIAGLLGLAWIAQRCRGFRGGALCPRPNERFSAAAHHGVAALLPIGISAVARMDYSVFAVAFGLYALWATALAIAYGIYRDKREAAGADAGWVNAYVETLRGAGWGAATWGALTYAG